MCEDKVHAPLPQRLSMATVAELSGVSSGDSRSDACRCLGPAHAEISREMKRDLEDDCELRSVVDIIEAADAELQHAIQIIEDSRDNTVQRGIHEQTQSMRSFIQLARQYPHSLVADRCLLFVRRFVLEVEDSVWKEVQTYLKVVPAAHNDVVKTLSLVDRPTVRCHTPLGQIERQSREVHTRLHLIEDKLSEIHTLSSNRIPEILLEKQMIASALSSSEMVHTCHKLGDSGDAVSSLLMSFKILEDIVLASHQAHLLAKRARSVVISYVRYAINASVEKSEVIAVLEGNSHALAQVHKLPRQMPKNASKRGKKTRKVQEFKAINEVGISRATDKRPYLTSPSSLGGS